MRPRVALIACHWGPGDGGTWMVWWSPTTEVLKGFQDEARKEGSAVPAQVSAAMLAAQGPLFYDSQQLIWPAGRPATLPQPETEQETEEADPAYFALLHTTVATWSMLTAPTNEIDIVHCSLPKETAAADRRVGIRSGPVMLISSTPLT